MLFLRLLKLRRRWRHANDERALLMSYYHQARLNQAHALAESYYYNAQRHEASMDRAAAEMLKHGGEPHMTTGELLAVAWRRLPKWMQTTIAGVVLLAMCLLACVNDLPL